MQKLAATLSNRMRNMSFVCACFIVLRHVLVVSESKAVSVFASQYGMFGLFDVAVPFFFFSSGYFLYGEYEQGSIRDAWFSSLKKRMKSLLVPFVIFCTICFVIRHVVTNDPVTIMSFVNAYGLNPTAHPASHMLWFVRTLFCYVLVAPVFVWGLQRRCGYVLMIAALSFWVLSATGYLGGLDSVSQMLMRPRGLFFFVSGLYCRHVRIDFVVRRTTGLVFIVGAMICLTADLFCRTGVWFVPSTVLSVIAVISFVPDSIWPTCLTKNSFPIYLLHGLVLFVFRFLFGETVNILMQWPVALVTIAICVLLSSVLRRFSPRVHCLAFGGR